MILIETSARKAMIKDALKSFPYECCGFLLGAEEGPVRTISKIVLVKNVKEGDKRRRYEISAKDYLYAEHYADEYSLQLLGVYHSHPNHQAVPSEHDRVAAQPYFSYVIISVTELEVADIRSWRLNNQHQFEEETINELNLIHQNK